MSQYKNSTWLTKMLLNLLIFTSSPIQKHGAFLGLYSWKSWSESSPVHVDRLHQQLLEGIRRHHTKSWSPIFSSWRLDHPFEKYDRQNGFIFPNFRCENNKYLSCHHSVLIYFEQHCDSFPQVIVNTYKSQNHSNYMICSKPAWPSWHLHSWFSFSIVIFVFGGL